MVVRLRTTKVGKATAADGVSTMRDTLSVSSTPLMSSRQGSAPGVIDLPAWMKDFVYRMDGYFSRLGI